MAQDQVADRTVVIEEDLHHHLQEAVATQVTSSAREAVSAQELQKIECEVIEVDSVAHREVIEQKAEDHSAETATEHQDHLAREEVVKEHQEDMVHPKAVKESLDLVQAIEHQEDTAHQKVVKENSE